MRDGRRLSLALRGGALAWDSYGDTGCPDRTARIGIDVMPVDAYKIDAGTERLIAIRDELARFVKGVVGGKRIHNSTAYRWALKGVRGRLLPTVRIGSRLYTSAGAFSWWARELAEDLTKVAADEGGDEGETTGPDVSEILRRAGIKD